MLIQSTSLTDYLLKTYEVHADDPLICLSLAVAYVSRAMQRQVDNRHHMVVEVSRLLPFVGCALLSDLHSYEGFSVPGSV